MSVITPVIIRRNVFKLLSLNYNSPSQQPNGCVVRSLTIPVTTALGAVMSTIIPVICVIPLNMFWNTRIASRQELIFRWLSSIHKRLYIKLLDENRRMWGGGGWTGLTMWLTFPTLRYERISVNMIETHQEAFQPGGQVRLYEWYTHKCRAPILVCPCDVLRKSGVQNRNFHLTFELQLFFWN